MKVEVSYESSNGFIHTLATLELAPYEIPNVGDYITVELTDEDRKSYDHDTEATFGYRVERVSRKVERVARYFQYGRLVSVALVVGVSAA